MKSLSIRSFGLTQKNQKVKTGQKREFWSQVVGGKLQPHKAKRWPAAALAPAPIRRSFVKVGRFNSWVCLNRIFRAKKPFNSILLFKSLRPFLNSTLPNKAESFFYRYICFLTSQQTREGFEVLFQVLWSVDCCLWTIIRSVNKEISIIGRIADNHIFKSPSLLLFYPSTSYC